MEKNNFLLKARIAIIFMGITLVAVSCSEEVVNQPPTTGESPDPIENATYISKPGGATITYDIIGNSTDYVLAEYEIRPGVRKQEKVSKYKNTLNLQGFAKSGKHQVTLYGVNLSEEKSAPITLDVEVMEPPYITAFESLKIAKDFGGINVSLSNNEKEVLSIEILTTNDVTGAQYSRVIRNTSQEIVNFSERGFTPELRQFWVTMRDVYGNSTDTVSVQLTPLFEKILDRSLMREYTLPTDYSADHEWHSWGGSAPKDVHYLFDGSTTSGGNVLHSKPGSGVPMYFTIDMGVTTALSRFRIWQRNDKAEYYAGGNPKTFEIWGSENPNLDGSWDSWTYIGTYTIIKPSDSALGTNTDEDLEQLKAGHEFNIPLDIGSVRYIRFKTLETWGKVENITFTELVFWGS